MEKNQQIIETRVLSGKGYYIFGKIGTNDIQALHQSISRFHLMVFTDDNLDLHLVDLGSKAGSFREVGQEYNRDLREDRRQKHLSVEEREALIQKKRKRKAELMVEKLQTLPLNKPFLAKLGKPEKLRLAHALKTGVVDVEKVNAMASVGSLELLRQTIDGITEEDMNKNVDVLGFAGEILESEKLRPWVPMRMSAGIDKVRIGLSTRHYYLVPDYLKVQRFLEKRQRELTVDSKMLKLKCKAGLGNDTLPDSLTQIKVLKTLYVGGIDDSMTHEMIRGVFEAYGEVRQVRIPTTQKGKFKGFCFVTFAEEEHVQEVLKSTGFYIKNKRLTVKMAEEDRNQLIQKLEQFERRWDEDDKIPADALPFARPRREFDRLPRGQFRRENYRERRREKLSKKHKSKKIKKKEKKKKKKKKSKRRRGESAESSSLNG